MQCRGNGERGRDWEGVDVNGVVKDPHPDTDARDEVRERGGVTYGQQQRQLQNVRVVREQTVAAAAAAFL